MGAWFHGIINMLMSGIITFLCFVVNSVYDLILLLADIDIFSNDAISAMKDKIFSLIALFMVFKLAFSIIQYIVDPDKLTDSTSGAQKLLVRIVISLALLTVVDTAFEKAMDFQNIILHEGILNKIIFGTSSGDDSPTLEDSNTSIDELEKKKQTPSWFISYTLVSAFVDWNDDAFEDKLNGDTCEVSPFIKVIGKYKEADISKLTGGKCYELFVKEIGNSVNKDFKSYLKSYDIGRAISKVARAKRNSELMISLNFFTPLFLIIFIVVLVIIAVNVAVRAVKLSALMIIAPLPIISYIDPKEKDGLFKKWYKLVFKTYLDLFIQLVSFYFAVFLITNIIGQNALKGYSGTTYEIAKHPLLYIFMIIGIFLFAMQLPKLISDLTGAKTDGLAKGIKSGMGILGTTAVAGVGGAVGGMVAGWQHGTGFGKVGHALASGLTGGIGSQVRGIWNGRNGGNVFANAGKAITASSVARNANWVRDSNGNRVRSRIPFVSSVANSFGKMAGLKNPTVGVGRLKADKKYADEALKSAQTALQDQMTARNDAFTRQVNAENEMNSLRGQLNSKLNNLDGIDGGFNNSTGDFELKYNNQNMSIRNLDYGQFRSAMYENRNRINSKRANGELDDQSYNRIMSNIDSLSRMSESEFNSYRGEISDLSSRLSSSREVYDNATTALNNANNQISSIRSFIDSAQKRSDSSSKNLDTLNKSLGK